MLTLSGEAVEELQLVQLELKFARGKSFGGGLQSCAILVHPAQCWLQIVQQDLQWYICLNASRL